MAPDMPSFHLLGLPFGQVSQSDLTFVTRECIVGACGINLTGLKHFLIFLGEEQLLGSGMPVL